MAASTAVELASTQTPHLIRLDPPLRPQSIPFHEALSEVQDSSMCPALTKFVEDALTVALNFASKDIPAFDGGNVKKSKGSTASVVVQSWNIGSECWVARKSHHAGQREAGDATWEEFDSGLRQNHSKNEMEYTPDVKDAVEVCRWSEADVGAVTGWTGVNMAVYEMMHKLPPPLTKRVFTILTLSGIPANPETGRSFITLTIPLELPIAKNEAKIASSKYAASTSVVHGAYTSVEHVYEENGKIVWIMATASDAKGVLPMPVQKLGIPGAITKDVGLLLSWVSEKRGKAANTKT